jgi:hypothetical protein
LVSTQRVLTQTQLARLLAEVPDRTLRYRTERLFQLGRLGGSRPYRETGSHPFPAECGLALRGFRREGETREPFRASGRERAPHEAIIPHRRERVQTTPFGTRPKQRLGSAASGRCVGSPRHR